MKSYTTGRNLYGTWTKNTSSANLTLGDQVANDTYRQICSLLDWPFLERTRTISTVASTQFYALPYDCEQVREIAVTVSNIRYTPRLAPDRTFWDQLNLSSYTSDIPEWYFVFNGTVGLWPTPASSSNTITVTQKTKVIDLSIADITSSTITTLANGSTALTLSGGLTTQMVGFYIRGTFSTTANTGDGQWYELSSITNSTTAVLVRAYGGVSIAAGTAASTIAQMPLLPEPFHDTPWKKAAADYWAKEADERATFFQNSYDADIEKLKKTYSSPTTNMVIDDGREDSLINPNLTVRL